MKKSTNGPLKKIACDPDCGFVVQSHEEKEVLDVARVHAKKFHDMNATSDQLREMMMTV